MKTEIQNSLQVFTYEGRNVTFDLTNGDVMVNLTEVAKAFPDKNLTHILNTQKMSEYIEKMSKLRNISLADLLTVKRGGNNNGTWAHQRIAIRVAQELSTDFAIWVDEIIEMLLTKGTVSIKEVSRADLARMVLDSEAENEKLTNENRLLESKVYERESQIEVLEVEIKQAVPKVQYHDDVMSSENLLTTTQIAKNYGWSAIKLNSILKSLKIQFKQSGNWMLYQKYANKGYAKLVPYPYPKSDGSVGTSYELKWFESGKKFIHNLLRCEGYIS